jgi:hypothetical protein
MRKLLGGLVIAGIAASAASAAASRERWIHVRIDDTGGDRGRVDIQVPLGLVSTLLPAMEGKHGHGSIHLDGNEVDLAELRRYWTAVRSAVDGEYVTVRDADSDVKVAKSGGVLRVTVDDRGGASRVRMKIPIPLVDAVLVGGDTIDLDAIGGALAKVPIGEILTVDDEDSHVRIWIDDEAAPAREDER